MILGKRQGPTISTLEEREAGFQCPSTAAAERRQATTRHTHPGPAGDTRANTHQGREMAQHQHSAIDADVQIHCDPKRPRDRGNSDRSSHGLRRGSVDGTQHTRGDLADPDEMGFELSTRLWQTLDWYAPTGALTLPARISAQDRAGYNLEARYLHDESPPNSRHAPHSVMLLL